MNENNSLVRRNLEESLSFGSLSDNIAAGEVIFLLIDASGSMDTFIDKGAEARYFDALSNQHVSGTRVDKRQFNGRAIDKLREAVGQIQQSANEPIPMIAFGGPFDAQVRFVDSVPEPEGGTPLHMAIPLAKEYGANRVVIISDGCPDLRDQSMEEARRFGGRIDVVYVGVAGDAGQKFLEALSAATGGRVMHGDLRDVKKITSMVIGLLEGNVAPDAGRVIITDASGTAHEEEAPEPVEPEDEEDDEDDDDEDDEDDDDSDDE